jgi:hypothetical protein
MKRLAVLFSIFALVIFTAPLFAAETDGKKADKKSYCCNKKKDDCKEITADFTKKDCTKGGGKVIKDCAKCTAPKPAPKKGKTDM